MQIVAWRRCGGWTCSFPVSVGTQEKHICVLVTLPLLFTNADKGAAGCEGRKIGFTDFTSKLEVC